MFCRLEFQATHCGVPRGAALVPVVFKLFHARTIDDASVLSKGRPTAVWHVPRTEVRPGDIHGMKHLSQNGFAKIYNKKTIYAFIYRYGERLGAWTKKRENKERNQAMFPFEGPLALTRLGSLGIRSRTH